MISNEITTTARECREIQAQIKILEETADCLRQQMIFEMEAQDVEELAKRYSKSAVSTRFSVA